MTAVKKAATEKRSFERYVHDAPVRLTHFNGGRWLKARTLNYCSEGMCVRSNMRFLPGTAVLIRMESGTWDGSCTGTCEDLPTITLGEVKWCRENPEDAFSAYEVGVKYYAPYY